MENPFNLSDEKLKILLEAYFSWSKENENEEKYPELEKQKSEERRKTLLNKEYISSLSDEELITEILNYSKDLEGPVNIRIGRTRVLGEIKKLKNNILYIIDSPEDPFTKAAKILEGEYKISIFSRSFWSPLFQAQYPELLPNWNNKTDRFLKKLGVHLTTSKKTIEEKYKLFSEAFLYLKNLDPKHNFYSLDHLTHYGTVISEGELLIDELKFDFGEWVSLGTTKNLIKEYADMRNRKDPELWQEEYKWDILPKANKEFFREPMTVDNIVEKIDILTKYNPTSGSFVHWNNLEDLKKITQQKPEVVLKSLDILFQGDAILCERIDYVIKEFKKIKKDAKTGTPLFGYILAMYDYKKYPLYKDSVFQEFKKIIAKEKEWESYRLGMKYQRFKELCLEMGEYLKKSNLLKEIKVNDVEVPVGITALDGQDFFYYLDKYNKDKTKGEIKYWRVVEPLDTKEYILWPTCKKEGFIAIGYLDKPNSSDVKNMRQEMKIGDKVIAYLEKNRIGGIGTVTGEYEDYTEEKPEDKDYFNGQFWRRRKVQWEHLPTEGEFWQLTDPLPGVHRTVYRLKKEEYEKILEEIRIPPTPPPPPLEDYTKEKILQEIFMSEKEFDQIVDLLKESNKKQLILQGPPGTGKTFIAQRVAKYITQDKNHVETIQFHPSYSYEDFIEGYRPYNDGFKLCNGIFKEFCEKAEKDEGKDYVLIIDEINRGNLSKIFGELLYLLEYRNQSVKLTYSQQAFSLPDNLYIIGTMNTADRSLAIMDYALRRRFYFKNITCRIEELGEWLKNNNSKIDIEELLHAIRKMNSLINDEMRCEDYEIGHSYFMQKNLDTNNLEKIIAFGVDPLLREYFFDKAGKIKEIISPLENMLNENN